MQPEQLAALMRLMHEHQVSYLECGDVKIALRPRPQSPKKAEEPLKRTRTTGLGRHYDHPSLGLEQLAED